MPLLSTYSGLTSTDSRREETVRLPVRVRPLPTGAFTSSGCFGGWEIGVFWGWIVGVESWGVGNCVVVVVGVAAEPASLLFSVLFGDPRQ